MLLPGARLEQKALFNITLENVQKVAFVIGITLPPLHNLHSSP